MGSQKQREVVGGGILDSITPIVWRCFENSCPSVPEGDQNLP